MAKTPTPTPKQQSTAQQAYQLPAWDPNPAQLAPYVLTGTTFAPGDLAQLRYADATVAPIMDELRGAVEALTWAVSPAEDTPLGRAAARVVEAATRSLAMPWSDYVGLVWDTVSTFGSAYHEICDCRDDSAPLGRRWHPYVIHAPSISRIVTDDTGLHITQVEQTTSKGSIQTFDPDEIVYWVASDVPGDFTGRSKLRAIVGPKRAYEIVLKTYLEKEANARGIYKIQQVSGVEQNRGQTDYDGLRKSIYAAASGQSPIVSVPPWADLDIMAPPNSANTSVLSLLQHFETQKRSALGNFLESLGIDGNTGNRSLGETLETAGNERWLTEISKLENLITRQGFIRAICEGYRIPHHLRPHLRVQRLSEPADIDDTLSRLEQLGRVEQTGILTPAQVTRLRAEILPEEDY